MKLLDVITAAGGRVCGGDPFLWDCYGENAQFMEFHDAFSQGYSHCIFDTKTYQVYEVYVEVPLTTNEAEAPTELFRWIHPDYKKAYFDESTARGEDPTIAWDDVHYAEVEDEETILEYVKDIGEGYFDNLPVPN